MNEKVVKNAKLTSINYLNVLYYETYTIGAEDIEQDREREMLGKFHHDPHIDLKKAFDGLKFHMAYLCKLAPVKELEDHYEKGEVHPVLFEILVTAFSLGGSGDHSGVTITGVRQLDNGKVMNVNTPFTKYQNEHEQYLYGVELEEHVRRCVEEVILYVDGKTAPFDPDSEAEQLSLFPTIDYSLITDDTNYGFDDDETF